MAERITKKRLERMTSHLAKRLKLTKEDVEKGTAKGWLNLGILNAENGRPYRLEIEGTGGDFGPRERLPAREMYAYLRGVMDALDITEGYSDSRFYH